ncbi:MAG: beta-N-acetylhexosaminidase [Gammaproteobacteria bacterium]|nr:MAG: beta-N-acetylhexosaminidase [Gammaproteobacteria bacterium]
MSFGFLMVDIEGYTLSDEDVEILNNPLVCGVILFSRNYKNKEQLKILTEQIRGVKSPRLVIAVDQEGGRVQRFKDGFTIFPPASVYADLYQDDPEKAKKMAFDNGVKLSAELLEVGVDFSFTPVLDIDYQNNEVIGDRAFGGDPQQVIELTRAMIDGLAESGMIAVGKHFPGHGFVAEDSHHELPVDSRSLEEIEAKDLVPFQELVQKIQGVMPAHIVYEKIDSMPAGFSDFWIRNILREQIGFGGVVFSDDISMKATTSYGAISQRVKMALSAGCDMVLICNDRDAVKKALDKGEAYQDIVSGFKDFSCLYGRIERG